MSKNQGTAFQGTYTNNPLYELPSGEPSSRTTNVGRYAFAAQKAAHASKEVLLEDPEEAWNAPSLLGWSVDDRMAEDALELDGPEADAAVAEITALASDPALTRLIREATGGRVAPAILTATGLHAVRRLVATLMLEPTGMEAGDALVVMLNAIGARIGDRPGEWLNSLALVGKRMAAAAYTETGTDFFACRSEPVGGRP